MNRRNAGGYHEARRVIHAELRSRLVFCVTFHIRFSVGLGHRHLALGGFRLLCMAKIYEDRPADESSRARSGTGTLFGSPGIIIYCDFALMNLHFRDPLPGEVGFQRRIEKSCDTLFIERRHS